VTLWRSGGAGLIPCHDDAFDAALAEVSEVEIDQQAGLEAGEVEERIEPAFVDGEQGLDGLDLDDHEILDEEIDGGGVADGGVAVAEVDWAILFDQQFAHAELLGEAGLVGLLHQAWSDLVVDLKAGTYEDMGEF